MVERSVNLHLTRPPRFTKVEIATEETEKAIGDRWKTEGCKELLCCSIKHGEQYV